MWFTPRFRQQLEEQASAVILAIEIDPSLPPQGFELVLGAVGTLVRAHSDLAVRYAIATLDALAENDQLYVGIVRDHPDYQDRAFMLDVSRDRVPTRDTLEWLVRLLASARYTQLQLYVEHTFAYASHETVWRDASPLTADDLRWLDATCAAEGVELVANLNTFGHFDRWLRHEQYRDRAECPEGSPSPIGTGLLPPWSLAPTVDNAAFAIKLAQEMTATLTSRTVNIGADEPFDLGRGVSADNVASRGRSMVYLEHLRRIVGPLVAQGLHVQFWGDVLRRHPELVSCLPGQNATALVWNYEAPSADGPPFAALVGQDVVELLGLPDDAHIGFTAHIRSYVETGYPFWVAAGTSTWNTFVGRWTNARENLLDAAAAGRAGGATGFMVTDWGDNGHHQPISVSVPAIALGGFLAWNVHEPASADLEKSIDELLGATNGVARLLLELGDLYRHVGVTVFNGSAINAAMHRSPPFPIMGQADEDGLRRAGDVLSRAMQHFAATPFVGARAEVIASELVAAARLARHGVYRLLDGVDKCPLGPHDLALDYDAAIAAQRQAWLAGARPGGFDDSLAKLIAPHADASKNRCRMSVWTNVSLGMNSRYESTVMLPRRDENATPSAPGSSIAASRRVRCARKLTRLPSIRRLGSPVREKLADFDTKGHLVELTEVMVADVSVAVDDDHCRRSSHVECRHRRWRLKLVMLPVHCHRHGDPKFVKVCLEAHRLHRLVVLKDRMYADDRNSRLMETVMDSLGERCAMEHATWA